MYALPVYRERWKGHGNDNVLVTKIAGVAWAAVIDDLRANKGRANAGLEVHLVYRSDLCPASL